MNNQKLFLMQFQKHFQFKQEFINAIGKRYGVVHIMHTHGLGRGLEIDFFACVLYGRHLYKKKSLEIDLKDIFRQNF
jgi:hypothetical protein